MDVTAPDPPLQPRAGPRAALGGVRRRRPSRRDRVLDLLHQVKWYQDGTLTFRRSCAHGVCGSDAMLINGRNRLACEYLVKRRRHARSAIEPIRGMGVVKDLLVDMEPFWDSYRQVMPFLVNDDVPADGRERRQSPAEREPIRGHQPLHPVRRLHDQLPGRSGPTRSTSGRRRSSTPIGSSSTRATARTRSGSRSWPTRTASGDAGRPSTASRPARADIKITRAILEVTETRSAAPASGEDPDLHRWRRPRQPRSGRCRRDPARRRDGTVLAEIAEPLGTRDEQRAPNGPPSASPLEEALPSRRHPRRPAHGLASSSRARSAACYRVKHPDLKPIHAARDGDARPARRLYRRPRAARAEQGRRSAQQRRHRRTLIEQRSSRVQCAPWRRPDGRGRIGRKAASEESPSSSEQASG